MGTPITRTYCNFAGVDFINDPSLVDINRSPDALNIYKDYTASQGGCIQTRPGYRKIAKLDNKINSFYVFNANTMIIHSGTNLYVWSNFPSTPTEETLKILKENMNSSVSASFVMFRNVLYINDGVNYLMYDGTEIKDVKEVAFIPTTTIGRLPSGGGELYQDINVLQPKRKNSFTTDGTSKVFCLDATEIDDDEVLATVNDVEKKEGTDFTVDRVLGRVSFNVAPSKPSLDGQDNVVITYTKKVEGYEDRISKCTNTVSFDDRIFYSGNPDYPNTLFHCELRDPSYISDLNYYEDGSSKKRIKSMTVGNDVLWVFKEDDEQNGTIFYHTPTIDSDTGKVYPNKQGNISTGCYVNSYNFRDDIVFLSKQGLEGLNNEIASKQILNHRSSFVDNKMVNIGTYRDAVMTEWRGYLLILVDGYIFLADSRQKYQGVNGIEYEWYYWDIRNSKACFIKEYENNLYIGATDGSIFILDATNDDGVEILSYWTTPMDNFGYTNMLKSTNKRGGIAKIKTIPNGKIKVSERTNKKNERFISSKSATGFDFNNIDFSNFAFTTQNQSDFIYKIKEKKFNELSLKFYSDEKDKPFGLYSATIEVFVGGYIKK